MELENQSTLQSPVHSDWERATLLIRGTKEDLGILQREFTPHMTEGELRFCRHYYTERKKIPYFGELKIWDRVIAGRHGECEGMQIHALHCEDRYIAETHEDLLSKLRVLNPRRHEPPTLLECAAVSGSYLRMIGRSTPYLFSTPEETEKPSPLPYAAFVLLCPNPEEADYASCIESLLEEEEIRSLSFKRLTVSEYGLLPTLALHTKGLIGNPDLLPVKEGETLFSALGCAHVGRELWNLSRDAAPLICRLAKEHGLHAVYFARATEGEDFIMQGAEPGAPRKALSLSMIRELMALSYPASPQIVKEDLAAHTAPPQITESIREVPSPTLPSASLLCVQGELAASSNGFSATLTLCLDLLLTLVCRGIDRRAIAFYLHYTLPSVANNAGDQGQDLALLLGAYRTTMELSAPQPSPQITFRGEDRRVSCVAYGSCPRNAIPSQGGEVGDLLYYLPVWEEGFADFEVIRKASDRLLALWKKGLVHSARPVFGNLAPSLEELGRSCSLELADLSAISVGKRGILFASPVSQNLPYVGKISEICDQSAALTEDLE